MENLLIMIESFAKEEGIWYNEDMEILFTLMYAGLIGFYNVFKKMAVKKSGESTILVMFTTITFLLSLVWVPFGVAISGHFVWIFVLKGFILATSWFLVLKVLKTADLSIVTITNILSAVLSFVLGILIFDERAGVWQIIGSVIIILGVAAINLLNKNSKGRVTALQLCMLLLAALITTTSNVIDRYTTNHLTTYQVQFWFLLFVAVFSWIYFGIECIKNKKFLIGKQDLKNPWIYLVGIFLFMGDFVLFLAYKVPGSQMITISVLSKLKIVVTVLAGILIFKEKNIWKKILLTLLVILGAVMISMS